MIKKALLGSLVLLSGILGITQATVLNMEVGETYNYNGASITCDNNANCVSEFGDTILTGLIQGNSLQYQIIIRVGDDIAYFKDYGTYNFSRRIMEGCFTSLTNGVNANDYILNSIPNCSNSSGNFNTWIENASTYGGKLTSITFNTFGNQGLICRNYNEELGSFCVQFANNQYNEAYDWGMVSPITVEKLVNIGMSDSPFNGGGASEIPDIVGSGSKALTNGDVILGLSYRYGFSDYSCYGGYSLDNLFVPGSDPKDFTGFLMGSGASIFEIFNAYSGSYLTGIVKFYDSFYSRYQIGNLASFWDYPKGLYSIVERAYSLSEIYNLYPMNMSSLVEYCDLYLNSDRDSLYTGNNIVGIQGYYSLIGEIYDKRRYYDTDYLSGQSTGSVSIDEFFESISNRLVGGLQDIRDNRTGIVPTYILMVMMALILFRLISH